MRKFLILLFVSSSVLAAKKIRSEIDRYILLKDRQIVETSILHDQHDSFFSLDLNISSGLKELLADIGDSTTSTNTAAKTLAVNEILSKNVNTERQAIVDLEVGAPLPYFTYNHLRFLPSLYYSINVGASISVNNQSDPLAPLAQIYVQKTTNIGISSKIKRTNKKGETYGFSLYQRSRADLSVSRNAVDVVSNDDLINLDELKQEEKIYALDVSFNKEKPDYRYLIEVRDLKLMDAGSEVSAKIGRTPMFHGRYEKDHSLSKTKFSTFAGFHYREKYSLFEAIYIGAKLRLRDKSPALLTFKVDNQAIAFNGGLSFDRFRFHYGLKTPYRNPQDDMWVSATHQISMRFPF